ncbi:Serine/threonine-protein kinase pkn5 [Aquisphaera giovannonii]|uniref:Serine/threonine-protein kinase pkn5 n=1 Tax=Aquisphaera giovannonii TaxID=406548 RepID=A0A5B9WES7_9BACT|nr:protein kinase [Aquisphaera giovannonii]QEH39156.1 Serine/threonine-protein kinase pkn5 [Aquisphaera giovannonii]
MAIGEDESGRDDLLDRLAEEFAARLRRGERPALKEYADRYPELADEIRAVFPAMAQVERAKEICRDWGDEDAAGAAPPSRVGDYRIVREIGRGGMGVVYEAEQVSLGRRVALKVLPSPSARDGTTLARFRREARASARLHHTNIVPVFDVGQDGEVRYYAMQFIQGQSLDAVIRELRRLRDGSRPGRGGGAGGRPGGPLTQRMDAEADVALSLLTGQFRRGLPTGPRDDGDARDPGGPAPPRDDPPTAAEPSAVMPGGGPLSAAESRHRTFHRGVAQVGRQVASALAYAHARGILHRDIKPSNLLLDTEGVAWVSDFGLAKVDDDDLTRTGDILGTLRYMAPERFRGRGDARADVYSLGLTLYEMLVLRPAFDSPDRVALSEQIKAVEPPRPRSRDPRIPRDLETIVLKAIEKDPAHRYATAEAMAEDLQRFLDDQPVLARRARAAERYARWARRNPSVAVLGGVLTAVLLAATASSVLVARRMAALAEVNEGAATSEREARLDATAAREQADLQRERAERHLYTARIGQAESALRLRDAATARGLLDECRPGPGEPDRRGWEWSYLDRWCRPASATLALPTAAQSRCLAASPDGRMLAVGCWDPDAVNARKDAAVPVYLIGLPEGRILRELVGHELVVHAVAFRPDGRRLATFGAADFVRIWDTGDGRLLRTIRLGPPGDARALGMGWSPDGRRLAVAAAGAPLRVWDPETGRETARIARDATAVAWGPDGARIALALPDDLGLEVRPWDPRADRPGEPVFARRGRARTLGWSPDGRRLAATWGLSDVGQAGSRLTVSDAATGEEVFRFEDPAELGPVAFSPDGARVAAGTDSEAVHAFDAASGRRHAALFTEATQVTGLAFSADGRRLHAAGWGMGGVKVFDALRDPRGRRVAGLTDRVAALWLGRGGLRIREVEWGFGAVSSVDPIDGGERIDRLIPATNRPRWPRDDFAFSPDGGLIAAPRRDERSAVGVWDAALGRRVATLRGSAGAVSAVAFGGDGRSLAAAAGATEGRPIVTLWDVASGRPVRSFEAGPGLVQAVAVSGDGRRLAAGGGVRPGEPFWVTAWDAETGAVVGSLDGLGWVTSLAFHPDGSRIAVADFTEAKVHLWDLAAGIRITNPGPKGASCVRFLPGGERLASLGYEGDVHLADARTGQEVLVLRASGAPVGGRGYTPRMAFSPDGSCIVANAPDNALNLWDLGPAAALAAEPSPGDVAGWLGRGRALAERGDAAGAESAWARARAPEGRDPSPWIEHAAWLHRRGDRDGAREALARAMAALPDDPGRWLDLGRLLGRLGWAEGSAAVLGRARSLCERRLSGGPGDEAAAAALAELLPEADDPAGWAVLRPDRAASAAGATLATLPDGSVLAGGPSPPVDTYAIEATAGPAAITALQLEALTDPALPGGGPGRSAYPYGGGLFVLRSIRVGIAAGPSAPAPFDPTGALADHPEPGSRLRGVRGAIDADPASMWSIEPLPGRPHRAVFRLARPIRPGRGERLRVELASGHELVLSGTLGRFRLSVTDRPWPLYRPALRAIRADAERPGRTRLGAAYLLLGEWAPAAAALARPAPAPDGPAPDGFLLALALHHLGRRDDARAACVRALERPAINPADDPARDVAVEALATILGLDADHAEGLLLDRAFPADPFAR